MTNIPVEVKRREYEDYLFTSLDEIVEESETPELAAYRIALVLSFGEKNIDALRLEMYFSRIDLPSHTLERALHYFAGAGFLTFEGQDNEHRSYIRGEADRRFGTEMYEKSKGRIEAFQGEFWSDRHE